MKSFRMKQMSEFGSKGPPGARVLIRGLPTITHLRGADSTSCLVHDLRIIKNRLCYVLSSFLRNRTPKSLPFSNHLFTDSPQSGLFPRWQAGLTFAEPELADIPKIGYVQRQNRDRTVILQEARL